MRSTFKVIFYLKKRALKSSETIKEVKFPVMGRITINGSSVAVTCKVSVNPCLWDVELNRAKGKSEEAKNVNRILNNIQARLTTIYHDLTAKNNIVSAVMVKSYFDGTSADGDRTLITDYEKYVQEFKERVGKDRVQGTYDAIFYGLEHLKKFMLQKYGITDIKYGDLTGEFMNKFIIYLTNDLGYSTGYVRAMVRKCRKIVHNAVREGIIRVDPFVGYAVITKCKDRVPLEEEDIQKLMNVQLNCYKSRANRDMYLFMIFTGLSFCDLQKLKYDDIVTTPNGDMWIIDNRKKTDSQFKVKLLPYAKELVERYRDYQDKPSADMVFPVRCYNSMRVSLNTIANKAGITRRVTPHVARHTFATTIALEHGVPLETVSKMLGHKHITTTQTYAKVLKNKINGDMDILTDKIGSAFQMPETNIIPKKTA